MLLAANSWLRVLHKKKLYKDLGGHQQEHCYQDEKAPR
jgi:hypothetical protein